MVLVEQSDDISTGHTGNYLKVEIKETLERNSIVKVKITKRIDNYLEGEKND